MEGMGTGGKGFSRPQRPEFVLIYSVGNFHVTYYTHLLSLSTLAHHTCLLLLTTLICYYFLYLPIVASLLSLFLFYLSCAFCSSCYPYYRSK